jgi:hypothetical protein
MKVEVLFVVIPASLTRIIKNPDGKGLTTEDKDCRGSLHSNCTECGKKFKKGDNVIIFHTNWTASSYSWHVECCPKEIRARPTEKQDNILKEKNKVLQEQNVQLRKEKEELLKHVI